MTRRCLCYFYIKEIQKRSAKVKVSYHSALPPCFPDVDFLLDESVCDPRFLYRLLTWYFVSLRREGIDLI